MATAKPEQSAKARFDELIAWYVNGTLKPEDKQWVDNYLRDYPDSRRAISWHEELKKANDITDLRVPDDIGLRGLHERVNADLATAQPSPMIERIARLFATLTSRPAFALAATVLLAQTIAIGTLLKQLHDRDQLISQYRGILAVPQQTQGRLAALQVTFKSTASEQDIRALLIDIQGHIVDGPKQLGDYTIAVPQQAFERAKTVLEQSHIVEFVKLPASK